MAEKKGNLLGVVSGSVQIGASASLGAAKGAADDEERLANPQPAAIELYADMNQSKATESIPCMFRPSKVSIAKSAEWSAQTTAGTNVGKQTFKGGRPATMTLDMLWFDTSDTGQDVRQYTDLLLKLMMLDKPGQKTTPRYCRFAWGKIRSFLAYINDVSVTFTMFLPDGTPIRAQVSNLKLTQYDEQEPVTQNPTSRSEPRKTWVVLQGQRLDWIAYQEYGDSAHWRHLAQVNGLADPLALRPGQVLKLTPLE